MTQSFYVSPEQLMRDRAEFARKGIARGRSVVVLPTDEGIVLAAHNPSTTLHKVAELYDRIGFAAVGKLTEFDQLRIAGVRYADLRGYSYDRRDVTGRSLANVYAQTLGAVFTQGHKPYEVELAVAEVGQRPEEDRVYRVTYDGSLAEEAGPVVMGGDPGPVTRHLSGARGPRRTLADGTRLAAQALHAGSVDDAPAAGWVDQLEVAVLDRSAPRRTFRRLHRDQVGRILHEAP